MNDKSKYISNNFKKGCDCKDGSYSIYCCKGNILEQKIGQEEHRPKSKGAFSSGFSDGFNIK